MGNDEVFTIAADEAIFLPFFLMETIPDNAARIYLLLGNRMAYAEWLPGGDEIVKDAIKDANPRGKLAYIIVKSIGEGLYEYESGVAGADGLTPYVVARVHLSYTRGEAIA
jgi:hypothetical protein